MGLTQAEFAERIGISQAAVSKVEDGLVVGIDEPTLAALVQVTGYPVKFFQQAGGQKPLRESFFRKRAVMSARLLKQCEALINILRMEIEKLLQKAEPDARLPLPKWEPDEFIGGPREIARHLRATWGVPRGPVHDLISLIEDAGIIVVPFDFGTAKIDGVSITTSDGVPIILYNSKAPAARQRLTIAHELAHIIMHTIPTSTMEDEAFEFASEFLMPEFEIRGTLFPLDLDLLIRLKQKWQVSMQAILRWAKTIGALKESYYKYLMVKLSRAGWRTNEPLDDTMQPEKPKVLRDLVNLYLNELRYSPKELCSVLSANVRQFASFYLGETRPFVVL
jgi:Zn-dependent peptidase ImmA (M78 family)